MALSSDNQSSDAKADEKASLVLNDARPGEESNTEEDEVVPATPKTPPPQEPQASPKKPQSPFERFSEGFASIVGDLLKKDGEKSKKDDPAEQLGEGLGKLLALLVEALKQLFAMLFKGLMGLGKKGGAEISKRQKASKDEYDILDMMSKDSKGDLKKMSLSEVKEFFKLAQSLLEQQRQSKAANKSSGVAAGKGTSKPELAAKKEAKNKANDATFKDLMGKAAENAAEKSDKKIISAKMNADMKGQLAKAGPEVSEAFFKAERQVLSAQRDVIKDGMQGADAQAQAKGQQDIKSLNAEKFSDQTFTSSLNAAKQTVEAAKKNEVTNAAAPASTPSNANPTGSPAGNTLSPVNPAVTANPTTSSPANVASNATKDDVSAGLSSVQASLTKEKEQGDALQNTGPAVTTGPKSATLTENAAQAQQDQQQKALAQQASSAPSVENNTAPKNK